MYKIKQIYEDFYVEERPKIRPGDGKYSYFWLEKKGLNTLEAVKILADKLRINFKKIGYAGNKDRRAVTRQVCSVYGLNENEIKKLQINRVKLEFIGYGTKPISLGDLEGNKFEIVIRDLDEGEFKKIRSIKKMINYFDEQRFSSDNIEIGRGLVKGDFKKAIDLLQNNNLIKGKIESYLKEYPKNFVGAIHLVPRKLLMLFVHAYQSFIWNEAVKEMVETGKKVKKVEIVGFGTEVKDEITKRILEREGISPRDFIIRQIPEISAEGVEREVYVKVEDFKILERGEDELNKGKKKIKVSFSLPKGSYGTLVVKNLLGQQVSNSN